MSFYYHCALLKLRYLNSENIINLEQVRSHTVCHRGKKTAQIYVKCVTVYTNTFVSVYLYPCWTYSNSQYLIHKAWSEKLWYVNVAMLKKIFASVQFLFKMEAENTNYVLYCTQFIMGRVYFIIAVSFQWNFIPNLVKTVTINTRDS